MRSIVTAPMVKGEMSTRLTAVMDQPYRRYCGVCRATHLYEMPFRLAALRAGLELQAGTSPPVLQPVPGLEPAADVPDRWTSSGRTCACSDRPRRSTSRGTSTPR